MKKYTKIILQEEKRNIEILIIIQDIVNLKRKNILWVEGEQVTELIKESDWRNSLPILITEGPEKRINFKHNEVLSYTYRAEPLLTINEWEEAFNEET